MSLHNPLVGDDTRNRTLIEVHSDDEICRLVNARKADLEQYPNPNPNSPKDPIDLVASTNIEQENLWQVPEPIISKFPPARAYPCHALPLVLRDGVLEVHSYNQAPIPLIANSAIVSLSTAVQIHFDVSRDSNLIGPTSIFMITLADSGERKTACDKYFSKTLLEYQESQELRLAPEINQYMAESAAWVAQEEAIKSAIRRPEKKGFDLEELKAKLSILHQNKPVRPKVPRIVRTDDTPENLAFALANEFPAAGIISSEGGQIFGSRAMSKDFITAALSAYNSLWDGNEWYVGRKTGGSFSVRGARLSIGVQVQPSIMQAFNESGVSRGIGFLARCLFSYPESTQGQRDYRPAPKEMLQLDRLKNSIKKILDCEPQFENGI